MKLTRLKAVLAAALVAGAGTSAYADDAAEETVVATAEAEFWLGEDEIIVASDEKEFWLGPKVVEVTLPTGVQGYSYVVSNLTAGAEIAVSASVSGGATYALPIGAKVAIYCVPSEGYAISGTNPYVIEKVTMETTIDANDLPKAEKVLPLTPLIGGDIVWKASIGSGTVWAKLTLQVTNGQASAVSKVRYVFQDRPGATLWSAQKSARLTPAAELPKSEYLGLDQSVTWRYVEIPTSDAAYTGLVAGNRVTWGWSGDPTDNKVAWSEGKIELKKTNGVITAAEAGEYLGWVVWTAYGANYCAPVGRGAAAVSAALSAAAAASPVANDAIHAPITITEANRAVAFGSAYLMDGSDPRCEIVEFGIDDGAVHGRIALKGADGTPVAPGDNARVIVYGSEDLGTEFEECGEATRGEGGAFELATPRDVTFFKVKIEVEGAVK